MSVRCGSCSSSCCSHWRGWPRCTPPPGRSATPPSRRRRHRRSGPDSPDARRDACRNRVARTARRLRRRGRIRRELLPLRGGPRPVPPTPFRRMAAGRVAGPVGHTLRRQHGRELVRPRAHLVERHDGLRREVVGHTKLDAGPRSQRAHGGTTDATPVEQSTCRHRSTDHPAATSTSSATPALRNLESAPTVNSPPHRFDDPVTLVIDPDVGRGGSSEED